MTCVTVALYNALDQLAPDEKVLEYLRKRYGIKYNEDEGVVEFKGYKISLSEFDAPDEVLNELAWILSRELIRRYCKEISRWCFAEETHYTAEVPLFFARSKNPRAIYGIIYMQLDDCDLGCKSCCQDVAFRVTRRGTICLSIEDLKKLVKTMPRAVREYLGLEDYDVLR